jgi:phospholipid/cholesterol/gamma-HCH transport system permease protein
MAEGDAPIEPEEPVVSNGSLLTAKFEDGRLELAGGGSWTATHAGELESLVDNVAQDASRAQSVSIDMRGVREFDTFGAWLLERLTRQWSAAGRQASIVGLPEHDRTLLGEMSGVNRAPSAPPVGEHGLLAALAAFGRGAAGIGGDLLTFANMFGAIGVAAIRATSDLPPPCTSWIASAGRRCRSFCSSHF